MVDLAKYRSVVFDCDGVILDSNRMKSNAFRKALAGEDEGLVEEFIAFHEARGGVSRYVKFVHFYQFMKRVPDFEECAAAAVRRYSALTREGLRDCAEIPGVRDILLRLKERGVACFIVSGGDEDEVRAIFAERGLNVFFADILGSPRTKAENMRSLEERGYLAKPGLYFGDARSDMEAARDFGLDFVFIAGRSDWKDGSDACRKMSLPMYEDFASLT